jgi:hypothetical protein
MSAIALQWQFCSYEVSSTSVGRVICYDHFCVFQFFSILAVSMAMAAILKKSTPKGTISHGIGTKFDFQVDYDVAN